MKRRICKYWYLDVGDGLTFSSLAALRFHYETFLSNEKKRQYQNAPVIGTYYNDEQAYKGELKFDSRGRAHLRRYSESRTFSYL